VILIYFWLKNKTGRMAIKDMVISKGRKKGIIHTRDITLDDIREVFFPKDFNEKYGYLGYIYTSDDGDAGKVIRPLVLAMDKKAKPKWCPRWFLRLLDLVGNDKSIVRVRNYKVSKLFQRITKGMRFMDWKTKWEWYDLRISIVADQELQDIASKIERDYYKKGKQKDALIELMKEDERNGLYDDDL
jgi:hypothetical protein